MIEIVSKALSELIPYEKNPRKISDEAINAVAESIQEFGFKNPILIDKNNVIIAGHTRRLASLKLGLERVPCVVCDDLTPQQIKALRLADNKTNELAEWDIGELDLELEGLLDMEMERFGFDEVIQSNYIGGGEQGSLGRDYICPPLTILRSNEEPWLSRKREWVERINDKAQARADAKVLPDTDIGRGASPVSILDPVLAEIMLKWFAPKKEIGNNVFDCFAGDTAFGFVSSMLGYNFTGIELRQEQCEFNSKTLNKNGLGNRARYICDDGRNVLEHLDAESQDMFFSCPPYFNLEKYSDMENDASNQETFEDFYAILDTAFRNAGKCLRPNRFAVIVYGDVRNEKNGGYYAFGDYIRQTFKEEGFLFWTELIKIDPYGSAPIRARNNMRNRKPVKVHQNILVFYKGDPKQIQKNFLEVESDESQNAQL